MAIAAPGKAPIAAIIPTRNRIQRLLSTLSALHETPFEWEVVIADNGSEDDVEGIVKSRFPLVTVLPLGKNLQSAARNIAAGKARADTLMMLDDDSFPIEGAAALLLDALERDPQLGIAACMVRLESAEGKFEEGGSVHVHIGCGAAMRKQLFLDLGGYHAEYGTYVEEYDLAYRYMIRGLDVRFIPGAQVVHCQGERAKDFTIEKLVANNAYLAAKFYPQPDRDAHIEWIKTRYRLIAEMENATSGYEIGVEAIPEKVRSGVLDRLETPEQVLDKILPRRMVAPAFRRMKSEGTGRIAFVFAGKEIADLAAGARDAGLEVHGVYDDKLFHADPKGLSGLPLHPMSSLPSALDVRLFLGGISPGFIINRLDQCDELDIHPDYFQPGK